MVLETAEHLTGLLARPELRTCLADLQELAPEAGMALYLELDQCQPVLFANPAMQIDEDGSVANAETLSHLRVEEQRLSMSVLIDNDGSARHHERGELVNATLRVLDCLKKEACLPVAA